ncbi:polysaccharide deacetylase family protein [Granulicoccus phenolivorans]|uniref:polysaccharide deacetylase family protein n=1 Tax=Granulicoccus phenolivorans TaxID=266854 RepID=UPI000410A553|nr:polysaccharide deacetylase family protein [Granulicoccus phenolivorans]
MAFSRTVKTAAVALVAAVALAGCGTDPSQGAKGSNPSQSKDAPPPPPEFSRVDGGNVSGLTTVTYTDDEKKIRAEVPEIGPARTLTSAMEVLRERSLRNSAHEGATETNVGWQLIASSPNAVGMEVTYSYVKDGAKTEMPMVVWYDTEAKRVYSSPILIDAKQWGAFKKIVANATESDKSIDPTKLSQALDSNAAPEGNGPALGFDSNGDMIARFPSGALKTEAVDLRIPGRQVQPVLSAYGKQALDATTGPSAFNGTAKPAESASPTPASTASGASSDPNQVPRPSTAVGVDCTKVKCVALTFDDGPGDGTPKVVDAFVKENSGATFFMIGQSLQANKAIGKNSASSGMEMAAHSWTHPDLARISPDKLNTEVTKTSAQMNDIFGRKPMLVRPPFGSHNDRVDKVIGDDGASVMQWSVDTLDWQTKSTPKTEASALGAGSKGGEIVLMHDIHPTTVDAVPAIVKGMKDKGVRMVTLSELSLNSGTYEAGHGYCLTTAEKQTGFACKG